MRGLMMQYPLTLTHLVERAGELFPQSEIVTKSPEGVFRYTYGELYQRVHRLAHALASLGIEPGDRVGTLCWNTQRHLELYFAVPAFGAVLHTLNLRLADDQLAYIINHAGDKVIFADDSLAPVLERIRAQIPGVEQVVILPDAYEALLAEAPAARYGWPALAETTACATCYTSGTTGNPKGVLYDHRSIFLHSMSISMADVFGISRRDTVLQVVPMFHANGWGLPYAALMNGAKIVLSGRQLQPADLAALIESERVTFTCGVPTLWMGLYAYLETHRHDISSLRAIVVAGSALPKQFVELYARKYALEVRLAWGMTETTPIATVNALEDAADFDRRARHGRVSAGLDLRILGDDRQPVPRDGKTMGELQIRGAWITSGYYETDSEASFDDGWFRTGDVATIDEQGAIQIMDRTKDLVKSGGEWISSVDLENLIMGHPHVMEAAVIALPHPRWEERPLACVVPFPEHRGTLTAEAIVEFLRPKVAKWWLPDEVVFLDAVPKTSVGKFNKRALRQQFEGFVWK